VPSLSIPASRGLRPAASLIVGAIAACAAVSGRPLREAAHDRRLDSSSRFCSNWKPKRPLMQSCPYCGAGCALTLHVQEERIVKVTSPVA
jgi:anaerobic selenocysteine-containing dehydrogenase